MLEERGVVGQGEKSAKTSQVLIVNESDGALEAEADKLLEGLEGKQKTNLKIMVILKKTKS